MDIGRIQPVDIIQEMQKSYLDYAMSVIVSRALPDVRDGLKPVQRRILYAMHDLGLKATGKYSKSAKVVGEVLGKYHPHGDAPVYEALVRMAQDFSMRYLLVDGQGNFGSVDGDSAAAMRYTEVKLTRIADEMLVDLEKDTVAWIDNFDGSLKEPVVLPASLPNLLLNGVSGIAVGMATQIPPHNLGEVIDAIVYMIDKKTSRKKAAADTTFSSEATVEELMQFIKGPDFPTGAQIYDISEIAQAYAVGRGRIVMRAKADIEESRGNRYDIVVTELPYQVNKANLIERIADLVKNKKLDGISDLRDESDRRGMRVVVELKRDAKPKSVLNNLYKHTAMQSVFNVNTVALVDGTPQLLTLKHILEEYIKHRVIIITRRSEFELKVARDREHILLGLKIAVDNIDEVIETIKKSQDADTARENLMRKFKLSQIQAQAILDMQLKRLAALERQKIEDELAMVHETIAYLEDLLSQPAKILHVAKGELLKIKGKYADDRKTRVFKSKVGEFSEEDLIANEATIIALTKTGYIKRQSLSAFRMQQRGGKGVLGMGTKEEDEISQMIAASTHDTVLFVSNKGKVFSVKAYDIAEGSRSSKGQAVVNLINVDQGEIITSLLAYNPKTIGTKGDYKFAFMVTRNGTVKKTELKAYENIRRNGLIAIKLESGDQLTWTKLTTGQDEVIIVTRNGQSIRFGEGQVRPTSRDTTGVRGINIKKDDQVVGMEVFDAKADLLVVAEKGLGKKTAMKSWPKQGRGGQGVKAAQLTSRTGKIVSAQKIDDSCEMLILTSHHGQAIKLPINSVPQLGRQTQGVILMRFTKTNDSVAAATCILKEPDKEQAAK